MSGSVNRVILIGNVGKDPEIRRTQSGQAIANLSLATSETWRDKSSGERKERTEWHRISVFNEGLVKVIEQYVHKGSKLYVEGQLQTRKWQDQSGNDRYSTEVVLQGFSASLVLLDSKGGTDERTEQNAAPQPSYAEASGGRPSLSEDMNDEIPFSMEWR